MKNPTALPVCIILLLFPVICTTTWAADEINLPVEDDKVYKPESNSSNFLRKLRGNEPSYFVIARDDNETVSHIEFYLSIKYPIGTKYIKKLFGRNSDLFFNYNGKYDFYANSRYSSPVISRLQNPGLMYEYTYDSPVYGIKSVKTGYFHESNGQTIDTAAQYAATENAQDYVSRGWDYIPLDLKFEFPRPLPKDFVFYFKGRYFLPKQLFSLDKEDEIFWEPVSGSQPRIEDYDGLRTILRKTVKFDNKYVDGLKLSAVFRTGYHAFNLSQKYEATFRIFDIPFYIFYFTGYGNNISTYHIRSYAFAFGFEMW